MSMEQLDSVLSTMPESGSATETPAETTVDQVDVATAGTETTNPESNPDTEEPAFEPEDFFEGKKERHNAAFAKMRTENKQLRDTMSRIGNILGVTDSSPEALIKGLNDKILEFNSQQSHVPIELLRDLEQTKSRLAEYEQSSLREQALIAFQKVKDNYGLSNKQLEAFAQQLNEQGINPFQSAVDLDREYWNLNRESLVKQIKDQTEREVLAKQAHAAAHSTTPSKNTGGQTPTTPTGSIAALDALLATYPGSKK